MISDFEKEYGLETGHGLSTLVVSHAQNRKRNKYLTFNNMIILMITNNSSFKAICLYT